ncbi:glycosyltransferase [Brevibacillus laterosporus]|uniref:glycosyltransferase n=2 Tax=Brevibacillus laterosporus TaxID=1465 RepID=UPI003D23FECF
MKTRLLGVHMIVRNEEELLPRCLDSIRSIDDEIVIVDTGSTDRTREIALTYEASVIQTEWENDFSKARNVSLAHATTEWILMIDTDEEAIADVDRLRDFLSKRNVIFTQYESKTKGGGFS